MAGFKVGDGGRAGHTFSPPTWPFLLSDATRTPSPLALFAPATCFYGCQHAGNRVFVRCKPKNLQSTSTLARHRSTQSKPVGHHHRIWPL